MSKHFCMLAQPYDPARVKSWPVAVEPKLDGFRLIVHASPRDGSVEIQFLSRSGKPFTSLNHLRLPISRIVRAVGEDIVLDGEVTSGTFKETSSSVRRKSVQATDAVFTVFDAFYRDGVDTYTARRSRVLLWTKYAESSSVVASEVNLANNESEVKAAYDLARGLGHEGIIVKDVNAQYEFKRSYAWMKIKGYESEDLYVTGVFAGEGKHAGRAGGIVCLLGNVEVRVGTGFTDEQREDIWANRPDIFGRIAEIGYHEKTPGGSLRHPRVIRFRDTLCKGEKE